VPITVNVLYRWYIGAGVKVVAVDVVKVVMKSGTWSWVDKFTVHKKLVVNKFYMPPFGSQCTHFWEKFLASVVRWIY
jgi:hypothetical protein